MLRKEREQKFIEKAKSYFPDYDYSLVQYKSQKDKVTVICPIHGSFDTIPQNLQRGHGCPECGKQKVIIAKQDSLNSFIEKANKRHNSYYKYDKSQYIDSYTKLTITCPIHGDFQITPNNHLNGQGCLKCGISKRTNNQRNKNTESFMIRAKQLNPELYFDRCNYIDSVRRVEIGYKLKSGKIEYVWVTPQTILYRTTNWERLFNRTEDTITFIRNATEKHNGFYSYDNSVYTGSNNAITVTCPFHGDFETTPSAHLSGTGCKQCALEHSRSTGEIELFEYIQSLIENETVLSNYRIKDENGNDKEIDIYIPSKKIGIEFNGLYWHCELFFDRTYHRKKLELCESKGIQLITVFEDEWNIKREIIKERLKHILQKDTNKIYARNCTIREIISDTEKVFVNKHHLQSYVRSDFAYGLFHKNKLVAVMSFGRVRFGGEKSNDNWELYRYCTVNDVTIVGGASKLFMHFVRKHNPLYIVSYADRRFTTTLKPSLYNKLNFKFDSFTDCNYTYLINKKRHNRFMFNKQKLIDIFQCKPEMTEHDFMLSKKWYRIYDCGSIKFIWTK